jgi:hypothetical protein
VKTWTCIFESKMDRTYRATTGRGRGEGDEGREGIQCISHSKYKINYYIHSFDLPDIDPKLFPVNLRMLTNFIIFSSKGFIDLYPSKEGANEAQADSDACPHALHPTM